MAGARKGPGKGDGEERPRLDKVLAGRAETCQGGTGPVSQKRRCSVGASQRNGVSER